MQPVPASPEPSAPVAMNDARARTVLVVMGAAILYAIAPYIPGLLGAAMVAVVLAPAHRRLSQRMRPRWSALVCVLAALVILVFGAGWLLGTLVTEAGEAMTAMQQSGLLARLSTVHIGPFALGGQLAAGGTQILSWLSGHALALFGSATRATLNLCLAFFGAYYLLESGGREWAMAKRYLPFGDRVSERLRRRFVEVTEAELLGTVLTALVQGTVVGAGFAIVGIGAPVLAGFATACVSVLPVLGSAIVWLPGVAYLVLVDRYLAAAALLVIGAGLASNLDNVVRMVLYRRISGIHPMLTLLGAFAGVGVFGLVGVLIGPLVLSYFFALLHAWERAHPAGPAAVTAPPDAYAPPAPGVASRE